jgi:hypothetical protein
MYICLYLYVYIYMFTYFITFTAFRVQRIGSLYAILLAGYERLLKRGGIGQQRTTCTRGLQARRRIPWGRAMPVPPPLARGFLSTQRLSVRRRGTCPVHAARTVRTPTRQQKAKVYALPLYAESAPCNQKPHPACMRGGQSANTLQTHCKQQAPESPPQTIPGNRAEVGKMPALKGFRRCPSAHQMRQLTSYADGFDKPYAVGRGTMRGFACLRQETVKLGKQHK